MLHLALAALLVGAPINDSTDRTTEGDRDKTPRTEAPVGIVKAAPAAEEAPINDTYAYGREEPTPIKIWVGYAWAKVDEYYAPNGNTIPLSTASPGVNEQTVQRAFVGAQADFINLPFARLGVGAQLMMGSDRLDTAAGDAESGFGLQNAKFFAQARGNVLGIHGGYILDLGNDPDESNPVGVSDRRNAIFFGANFDYPSEVLRLFGGVDYFMLQDNTGDLGPAGEIMNDLVVFNMGAGVRISWVEIGAAALLRANRGPSAGHQGSIAPYLNLSPTFIPASISIRGAVTDEYADYGFSLGGARKPVTQMGFTVAATYGF